MKETNKYIYVCIYAYMHTIPVCRFNHTGTGAMILTGTHMLSKQSPSLEPPSSSQSEAPSLYVVGLFCAPLGVHAAVKPAA